VKNPLFVVRKASASMSSAWFIEGWTDGKRKRFYFKSEEEAKESAKRRNEEIAAFGSRYAISDEDRQELILVRKLLLPGESLVDVVRAYADKRDKTVASVSVKDFCATVLAEYERRSSNGERAQPRHVAQLRPKLVKFANYFGAERPIKSITGLEVKDWVTAMPTTPSTRNNYLSYCRLSFAVGKEQKLIDINPMIGVKPFTISKSSIKPPRPLTPQEMVRLIDACGSEILPFVLIGGFAGLRAEERHKLLWEHIKEKHIDLPAAISKTGHRRLIPIEPNLAAWLKRCRKTTGLISPPGERSEYSRKNCDEFFRAATKAAGFKHWPNNALRDSYCSYYYEKSGSADRTSDNAGHSIEMLKEHYRAIVTPEDTVRFWNIFPTQEGRAEIRLAAKD
jgi:integrase